MASSTLARASSSAWTTAAIPAGHGIPSVSWCGCATDSAPDSTKGASKDHVIYPSRTRPGGSSTGPRSLWVGLTWPICFQIKRPVFDARGWRAFRRPYCHPPTGSRIPNGSPDSNAGRPLEAAFPASSRAIAAWASSAGATPPDRATPYSIRPAVSPAWSSSPA